MILNWLNKLSVQKQTQEEFSAHSLQKNIQFLIFNCFVRDRSVTFTFTLPKHSFKDYGMDK